MSLLLSKIAPFGGPPIAALQLNYIFAQKLQIMQKLILLHYAIVRGDNILYYPDRTHVMKSLLRRARREHCTWEDIYDKVTIIRCYGRIVSSSKVVKCYDRVSKASLSLNI